MPTLPVSSWSSPGRLPLRRPTRIALRLGVDALIGLALFLVFTAAVSMQERTAVAQHRLGDILAVSSSAGDLLRFSLHDSPLIAAAVVATAVPVTGESTVSGLPRTPRDLTLVLLAGIFSGLVAMNLAFFRHLRRAYASPR